MKRNWELEELIDTFTIMPNEMDLLGNKTGETRLGFMVLLKFFQVEARFPSTKNEIPRDVVKYIAKQLQLIGVPFQNYDINSRAHYYHKEQIRNFLGFREITADDGNQLTEWLSKYVFYHDANIDSLKLEAYKRLRELHIEPPTSERIDRIARAAINIYEDQFFKETNGKLSRESIDKMNNLLNELTFYEENEINYDNDENTISFGDLRSDPGRIGLESFLKEISKLKTIQQINLPDNLFSNISQKILKKYKHQIVTEDLTEIRRHPELVRNTLLAIFFWLRYREITDNLIELLIQIIHRIGIRAENKVEKELLNDFKKVNGKNHILQKMVDVAVNYPEGIIKDVLYPVVSEKILKALVKEFKSSGTHYNQRVYTIMRASYGNHYRRMVPELLNILEFRSNNDVHKPVINALELIKEYTSVSSRYFNNENEVPIDGVIKSAVKPMVMELDDKGLERINRINYEIVVLQALRDKLRCKEIWVTCANKYRNPDEDLPADFEERREENYKALNKPLNAEEFISGIKQGMYKALLKLDSGMPTNSKVRLSGKNNGYITLSPSEAQLNL